MDSIRIESGKRRIAINDDPERVITFDPQDILFAERFYAAYLEFETKKAAFEERLRTVGTGTLDGNGIPIDVDQGIACMKEMCVFMREKIDLLFGAGTSEMVFGDTLSLEMIGQFLDGITPFIQRARSQKTRAYAPTGNERRGRVMK